jgi:hypothetical protein
MKKYLLIMLLIPTLLFADAVIFSGSDVKTLKGNIDLFGRAKILTTSTIPTAGLTAPKGSIAMYTTTGDLYLKTGALNTDWTKNQTGPVNLTTDVTGILPIANGGTGSATQNFVDLTTAQTVAGAKNFTDALTVTSNSANSLAIGPNGTTNPVLQIDSSAASAATGLKVTGNSAGSGVLLGTISSGTNENVVLAGKGTGSVSLQVNGSNRFQASASQISFGNQAVSSTASTVRFTHTGAADTSLTASTEAPNVYFNMGQTRQHATGTLTLQRDFRVTPSTHSFVGASTLTNAAAFSVDGPANGGANATVTNSSAIYVPSAAIANTTNTYGLNISAATGGTNNYAATFQTGNVGMGTAAPATNLEVKSLSAGANSIIRVSNDGSATGNSVISFYRVASDFGEVKYVPGGGVSTGMYYNSGRTAVDSHHTFQVNGSDKMRIDNTGSLVIGSITANANAILDVQSTTKAFMPPRMTTAQKNAIASPTAGMVVYDTNMKGISFYNGTAWVTTNNKSVSTKTANYTALQSDDVILGDATSGAITITLPTAVGNTGEVFHIKKIDSSVNAVTIATTSSQTIDGVTTQTLGVQYKNLTVVSNGSGWDIL